MRKVDVIAGEVVCKFSSWQEARSARQERWVRHSRVARLQEDRGDAVRKSEGSTIKMPVTKSAISMAMDNLYQMLFGPTRFFDIAGRTADDDPEVLKQYIAYLMDKDKVKHKFRRFLSDLCTYGTGICRVNVKTEIDKQAVRKGLLGAGGAGIGIDEKEVNRPELEWVDIFDFFIEPQAQGIEESEGVIVRKVQKLHLLRGMQSRGLVDGVNLIGDGKHTGMDDDKRDMLKRAGIDTELKDGDVTLLEYWGWLDEGLLKSAGYDGEISNGGAEVVCLVANGQTVLRLAPNPFLNGRRPFLKECFEEIPGQFYGLGICDVAEGAQKALDATVRSRIDNKKIAINQVFAVDVNRITVDKDGKIFPGKTFFTDGNPRDIIQQLDIRDVTHGSYREALEFERYIHEGTGISPILAGMSSGKSQTATEASIAQNQSSIRLRMIALQIEENVIIEVLRWFYLIALQFLNHEEVIRVTNADIWEEQTIKVTQEAILGDYDFIPLGVMSMTAKNNFNKIMDFLSRTANQFDIQVTDRAYLLREAYKALGFNDAEKVFRANNQKGKQMLEDSIGVKGVAGVAAASKESSSDMGGLF